MKPDKKNITKKGIDKVLSYLPIFTQPDYKFSVFHSVVTKNGINTFPYYEYSNEVDRFIEVLYAEGFVEFYDWPSWQTEAAKYGTNPELLKTADLETIVKLFTTHVRSERFCEGHLNAVLNNGRIIAILNRLKEIREEM